MQIVHITHYYIRIIGQYLVSLIFSHKIKLVRNIA